MTFNFIFRQECLYKSNKNAEMVLRTISLLFDNVWYFYKDMFLEVPDEK